jgi:hypothetical protein
MSTTLTISLRERAEQLDHFAVGADDFATAGLCRATAARIREIASEIDRLECLLTALERRWAPASSSTG